MIKPTVGRVVWFHPSVTEKVFAQGQRVHIDRSQPLAAIVTHVWSENCVNLVVFDSIGNTSSHTSVQLKQDPDEFMPPEHSHCEWMPFQIGQAKKHEQPAPAPVEPPITLTDGDAPTQPVDEAGSAPVENHPLDSDTQSAAP